MENNGRRIMPFLICIILLEYIIPLFSRVTVLQVPINENNNLNIKYLRFTRQFRSLIAADFREQPDKAPVCPVMVDGHR